MKKEVWRFVVGYEGLYMVSNFGRVKSLISGIILKQPSQTYKSVELWKDGKGKRLLVHHLVAFAFPEICGEWFDGAEINHKDENPGNNCAWNLEWVMHKVNCNYGTRNKRAGEKISISKKGKLNTKKSKVVYQYDLKGNFIREWSSCAEVQRQTGISQPGVSMCCIGKLKQHRGYIWSYSPTLYSVK